jgi:cell division inhibitor SepF
MPGAMRKMGVYLGLVEDDDEALADGATSYDRGNGHAEYAEPRYSRGGDGAHLVPRESRDYREEEPYQAEYTDVEYPSYRITTLHPRNYNEARTIGEHFRTGTPVIMNLSEMDDADAKRLVDFAAGLTFGLHGRLERVTAKVFLLSPHNVTVTAQDKARIAEGGFFNQS